MLLRELIKTDKKVSGQTARGQRVQKASRDEGSDSRCVQVKSAVRRSEKPVFEELARKRETTLSDLIRDFLLEEAQNERLL